jgi:hypothetical protein
MTDSPSLRVSYQDTIITITLNDGSIYTTSQLTPPQIAWPFESETIYVITAWNPRSQRLDAKANNERNLQLAAIFESRNITKFHAAGHAIDNSWHEDGFAVSEISIDEIKILGVHFDQNAIFEVTEFGITVIECLDF